MEQNQSLKFEIYQELGECYTQVGEIEKAMEHFSEARCLDSDSDRPLVGMGVAVLQQNRLDEAEGYFNNALQTNPNSDKALTGLAITLGNIGRHKESFSAYQDAHQLNPANLTALMGLVQSAYAFDQLNIAVDHLNGYLSLYPANIKILYCLAGTYFKQGRLDTCRETLDRILIFEPDHKDANELLTRASEADQSSSYGKCQNS